MAVTPDTTIKLLKVPIEIDNLNQLTFATKAAQYNYFNSLPSIEEEDLYYQRKDNFISFPAHIDSILEYNYCMYQNSNYSNKWFYAFITRMEYENDGMTRVYIETDTFQSWQFDIQYKASFVEREHVNDDTIGKHTIPENLDVGEVILEGEDSFPILDDTYGHYVGILSSYIIEDNSVIGHGKQFDGISVYNGNVFGTKLFLIKIEQGNDYDNLLKFIMRTNQDAHIEDIDSIFILPSALFPSNVTLTSHTAYASPSQTSALMFTWYTTGYDLSAVSYQATINKPTSYVYSGITIKNNKCFTYPYSYVLASNNAGSTNIYKYENFDTPSTFSFDLDIGLSIGVSGRLIPKNYKGMPRNEDEALPLAKYPTCAWSGDAYTNWLTQNSVNMAVNSILTLGAAAFTIGSFGAGAAAAESIGLATKVGLASNVVMPAANTIGGIIGQFHQASLLPNIEGGQATGDVLWGSDKINFVIKRMRAKNEYMQVIDDYFSAYGYKVNSTKIPNITGRTNWNYVKTINCNIEGNIPQEDLQKIKDMFNQGVTLWHNPSTFLDYTQSNAII